ncbi:hypothetical protein BDN72DRAFT_127031 [Pluteus cervinus]|uniref:Uncharacterized protein n=1 Tax=Pluteus cervinus TaxID=181527 RepID=A0ACD3APR6_9AGAR|nr:hypothetical protein BDN72DRAFT_127031 [Pluteus cervinus]
MRSGPFSCNGILNLNGTRQKQGQRPLRTPHSIDPRCNVDIQKWIHRRLTSSRRTASYAALTLALTWISKIRPTATRCLIASPTALSSCAMARSSSLTGKAHTELWYWQLRLQVDAVSKAAAMHRLLHVIRSGPCGLSLSGCIMPRGYQLPCLNSLSIFDLLLAIHGIEVPYDSPPPQTC